LTHNCVAGGLQLGAGAPVSRLWEGETAEAHYKLSSN